MSHFDPTEALIWYLVFLYSTVCHEAGHAWAAMKLGDWTAYEGGQVSLDPIPHIRREPFGMVLFPIVSFIIGGWMIGWASAPYDPLWAERHPRRAAWMAFAGPAANLILVLSAGLLIRAGMAFGVLQAPDFFDGIQITQSVSNGPCEFAAAFFSIVFTLNLLLLTFNLLPLPPLDGSNLPFFFLSPRAAQKYREILWNPTFRLFGLFVAFKGFGQIFPTIQVFALNLLYPGYRLS